MRMTGISLRNFRMFGKFCGDASLKNVAIVTNMWSLVDPQDGDEREAELRDNELFFKPALDKGAQLLRHDSSLASAQAILGKIVGNKPMALRIQEELVDEGKAVLSTDAGVEVNREVVEQARKHAQEIEALKEEMVDAIKDHNEQAQMEVEKEKAALEAAMKREKEELRKVEASYKETEARMEERLTEISETAKEKAEELEKQKKQLLELATKSKASLDEALQEIQRLEKKYADDKADFLKQMQSSDSGSCGGGGGCIIA